MSIEIYHLFMWQTGRREQRECTLTLLFHQFQPSRRIKIPELPDIPARLFPRHVVYRDLKKAAEHPAGNDVAERFF